MSLSLLALAVMSALVLTAVRRRVPSNGDDVRQSVEVVAVFGALGAPCFLILALLSVVGPRILNPGMPIVLFGAVMGTAFAGVRGAVAVASHLLRWGLRQESEFQASWRHTLRVIAELGGYALCGTVFVTAMAKVDAKIGSLALLAVPILLATYPLFDLVVMPWVTRLTRASRSIGSQDRYGDRLQAWASEAADGEGLQGARLEVVETEAVNAWAIHMPFFRPTIMLSRPLLERFTEDAVLAILAHEVAHISSNHVPRMMLMSILGGTLFGLTVPVLFGLDLPGGLGTGAVLVGLVAVPLLGLGPGWFSKRFEFEADAKAASMVGAEIMQKALLELADHTGGIDQESFTHPPISARVRRLGPADD